MFRHNRNLFPEMENAIKSIDKLLEQLNEKKKEWENFRHKKIIMDIEFFPKVGNRYSYSTIDGGTEQITKKFANLVNRMKKVCIKLCSDYISLLQQAKSLIGKKRNPQLIKDLTKIDAIMNCLYNEIFVSSWRKEIGEEHKIEFKEALRLKRIRQELAQKISDWDTDWLESEGLLPLRKNDPEYINRYIKSGEELATWKNWRKNSVVKNEFRRQIHFQKFIKSIIEQYKELTNNMST